MFTVVHAQISSTSRVLRSAWTVVLRGDCIFPSASSNLAATQKQEEGRPNADWARSLAAISATNSRTQEALERGHHKFVRESGQPSVGKLVVSVSELS